ncbi:MAG: hypothetical protein RLZZ200_2988, partial [Pseudomonadota bacterium]
MADRPLTGNALKVWQKFGAKSPQPATDAWLEAQAPTLRYNPPRTIADIGAPGFSMPRADVMDGLRNLVGRPEAPQVVSPDYLYVGDASRMTPDPTEYLEASRARPPTFNYADHLRQAAGAQPQSAQVRHLAQTVNPFDPGIGRPQVDMRALPRNLPATIESPLPGVTVGDPYGGAQAARAAEIRLLGGPTYGPVRPGALDAMGSYMRGQTSAAKASRLAEIMGLAGNASTAAGVAEQAAPRVLGSLGGRALSLASKAALPLYGASVGWDIAN